MNAELQQELATLWWKILREDPAGIFGAEAGRLLNRNWGDQIPQPDYVGPAYVEGGLAFVSMNPGGMRGDGLGEEDRKQLVALKRLRDCSRVIGNNIGPPGRREIKQICGWLARNPVRAAQLPAAADGGQERG